jgi:5-methylcytosine-specific restriction endonuclease McrA
MDRRKHPIPDKLKKCVWDTYIGNHIPKHKCFCCKITFIKIREFHVGHVLSEKEGGTAVITNLRPICAPCNLSMGSRNMIEYAKTHGFY